jgi:hypothetical protein
VIRKGFKLKPPPSSRLCLLAGVFCMIVLSGCTPTVYKPNAINTPMFEQQTDLRASAKLGINGYNFQASYAFSDHFGIMGNIYGNKFPWTPDSVGALRRRLYELGMGYYTQLSQKGDTGRGWYIAAFAGSGIGITRGIQTNAPLYGKATFIRYIVNTAYSRTFLQGDLYFLTKNACSGGSIRLCYFHFSTLDYHNIYIFDNYPNQPSWQPGDTVRLKDPILVLEPGFTFQLRFPYVKFMAQSGLSLPLTDFNQSDKILFFPLFFDVGIEFALPLRKGAASRIEKQYK